MAFSNKRTELNAIEPRVFSRQIHSYKVWRQHSALYPGLFTSTPKFLDPTGPPRARKHIQTLQTRRLFEWLVTSCTIWRISATSLALGNPRSQTVLPRGSGAIRLVQSRDRTGTLLPQHSKGTLRSRNDLWGCHGLSWAVHGRLYIPYLPIWSHLRFRDVSRDVTTKPQQFTRSSKQEEDLSGSWNCSSALAPGTIFHPILELVARQRKARAGSPPT